MHVKLSFSPDSCYSSSCRFLTSYQPSISFDFYAAAVVHADCLIELEHCSADFFFPSARLEMIDGSCLRSWHYSSGPDCSARTPSVWRNRPSTWNASICWFVDGNTVAVADDIADIDLMMMTRHCDWEKIFIRSVDALIEQQKWNAGYAILRIICSINDWPWNLITMASNSATISRVLPLLFHRVHQLRFIVPVTVAYN